MSNLPFQFRPRPIDINKAIPIVRKEINPDELEPGLISRGVPQMPTGMEAEDEEEVHIQEAISRSLTSHPEQISIPTPTVNIVPGYDEAPNENPFQRPHHYIHYNEETHQLIEYDLDDEDADFLEELNASKKVLSEKKFEYIVDRLEREADRLDRIPKYEEAESAISNVNSSILVPIYQYWVKRRTNNNHNPLLTKYLKPPEPEDPSPYRAFRPRVEEKWKKKGRKNDQTGLMKLRQLRQEMERARTLLEMIKKRERLKRDHAAVIADMFDLQCLDLKHSIETGATDGFFLSEPEPIMHFKHEKEIKKVTHRKPKIPKHHHHEPEEYEPMSESEPEEPDLGSDYEEEEEEIEDERIMAVEPQVSQQPAPVRQRIPPFRGRYRIGRGGRVVFDRAVPRTHNGIVPYFETDEECCPRLNSLMVMFDSGCHPTLLDAEQMAKQFPSNSNQ